METQVEYEAEVLLAVFPSARAARDAQRGLDAAGIPSSESLLSPGRYQVADPRLGDRFRASIGAAIVGAIIGALIGAGVALWFNQFGGVFAVIVGLAVGGAINFGRRLRRALVQLAHTTNRAIRCLSPMCP
jgi:hypothetical protein